MFHDYVKINVVESHDGYAIGTYEITEDGLNDYGTVHGGMLAALADHVTGSAAISTGRLFVTQSCSLNYLSNQRKGIVTARADVIHLGKQTCVVEVKILGDDGKLLVSGSYTMYCVGEITPEIIENYLVNRKLM